MAVIFAQTLKIAQIMEKALNEEQCDRVLPGFAADPRGMLAIGITEPDNASNYFLPYPTPFRTSAQKTRGGWIVNGMKHFISNGNRASHYLLFAQTEKGKPLAEGSTCFLLERNRPGFTIGRVHDKMGERLANNAELVFQDCFIPDGNVVGEVARFKCCGLLRRATPTWRHVIGSPRPVQRPSTGRAWRVRAEPPDRARRDPRELAEMRMLIDASPRSPCGVLARRYPSTRDKTLGALQSDAAQSCWKIATWTIEIHGGHGYMKEPVGGRAARRGGFPALDGVNRTLFLRRRLSVADAAG